MSEETKEELQELLEYYEHMGFSTEDTDEIMHEKEA